jgi:hypothetical protein
MAIRALRAMALDGGWLVALSLGCGGQVPMARHAPRRRPRQRRRE